MDNYYTPDISDLFVGYECELFWNQNMLSENSWYPFIIDDDMCDFYFSEKIQEGKLRTPYLTKEQIEAEGWEPLDEKSPFTGKPYKWIKRWDGFGFNEPHKLTLEYYFGNHTSPQMKIRHEWESSWNRVNEYVFVGKCPSINELRKICKLLGI